MSILNLKCTNGNPASQCQIVVTDIVHPTPEYYFKTNRCISKEVAATNPQDDTLLIYNEDKNLELLKMYSIFDSMIDICY